MALNPNIGWHPPTRTRQPATGPQAQYRWPSEVRILKIALLLVMAVRVVATTPVANEDYSPNEDTEKLLIIYRSPRYLLGSPDGRGSGHQARHDLLPLS